MLISGQSVCSGCGSDVMLCERVSLLTNVTRAPGVTLVCVALTPADVIVMVVVVVPPPDGVDGAPPHAASAIRSGSGRSLLTARLSHPPSLPAKHGASADRPAFAGSGAAGYCTTMLPMKARFEASR